MARHKALVLFKLNSHAKMAPDIGIHLGDVVEESDGDLMGDGVNIAARLEGVCEPGAICLSEDAYRQVKGRLDLAVSDLGQTQLKNIAEPIRVYSLRVGCIGRNFALQVAQVYDRLRPPTKFGVTMRDVPQRRLQPSRMRKQRSFPAAVANGAGRRKD